MITQTDGLKKYALSPVDHIAVRTIPYDRFVTMFCDHCKMEGSAGGLHRRLIFVEKHADCKREEVTFKNWKRYHFHIAHVQYRNKGTDHGEMKCTVCGAWRMECSLPERTKFAKEHSGCKDHFSENVEKGWVKCRNCKESICDDSYELRHRFRLEHADCKTRQQLLKRIEELVEENRMMRSGS